MKFTDLFKDDDTTPELLFTVLAQVADVHLVEASNPSNELDEK